MRLVGGYAVDGTAGKLEPFLASLLKRRQATGEAVGMSLTTKVGVRVTISPVCTYIQVLATHDTRGRVGGDCVEHQHTVCVKCH